MSDVAETLMRGIVRSYSIDSEDGETVTVEVFGGVIPGGVRRYVDLPLPTRGIEVGALVYLHVELSRAETYE